MPDFRTEVVILIGLPASGKSSFYRERFATTHVHVSKDLMPNNVQRPERRQARLLADALAAGHSVVIDNINARASSRAPIIALARAYGAEVAGYFFETDAAGALRRNRRREGKARVPDVAIFTARKRLEPPSYEEGFDRLFLVVLHETDGSFEVRPQMR